MILRTFLWMAVLVAGLGATAWQLLSPATAPGPAVAPHRHAVVQYKPERLFPEGIDSLTAIEIVVAGTIHRFERDGAGRWFNHPNAPRHGEAPPGHTHTATAAESERLGKGFAFFGEAKFDRLVASGPFANRDAYGLNHPRLIVFLYRDGPRPHATLEAGAEAPDGLGRYVYFKEQHKVVVVPNYQIAGLEKLIAEMAQ